jgi:hypothetical protein
LIFSNIQIATWPNYLVPRVFSVIWTFLVSVRPGERYHQVGHFIGKEPLPILPVRHSFGSLLQA